VIAPKIAAVRQALSEYARLKAGTQERVNELHNTDWPALHKAVGRLRS
jgi:hypothetical protein